MHTKKGKEYYSYTKAVNYEDNDKLHDNKTSSPPPSSSKHELPKGIEGEVTAAIHSHPAGDALSEEFSNNTIANGSKGDQYVTTNIDEIDYYLLTPSGDLRGREGDVNVFLGHFNDNNQFKKGGALRNTSDKDLLPVAPEPDDPVKAGQIKVPWDVKKLPNDLKPEGSGRK